MPKQINLIINGKGGVGKSFFAVNFIQFLKDQGLPHRCIDADHENSTLKRFHTEADFIHLDHPQEVDCIVNHLEKTDLIVVDCRAASSDLIIEYFNEVEFFDILRTSDALLTVVCPINHESDSVEQVRLLTSAWGNRCRYVIVKNESHSKHFTLFENSATCQRLHSELQSVEIQMTRMEDWLVTSLNNHSVTASAATNHSEFTLVNRQRLRSWQRKFNLQIGLAAHFLLPTGFSKKPTDP